MEEGTARADGFESGIGDEEGPVPGGELAAIGEDGVEEIFFEFFAWKRMCCVWCVGRGIAVHDDEGGWCVVVVEVKKREGNRLVCVFGWKMVVVVVSTAMTMRGKGKSAKATECVSVRYGPQPATIDTEPAIMWPMRTASTAI